MCEGDKERESGGGSKPVWSLDFSWVMKRMEGRVGGGGRKDGGREAGNEGQGRGGEGRTWAPKKIASVH